MRLDNILSRISLSVVFLGLVYWFSWDYMLNPNLERIQTWCNNLAEDDFKVTPWDVEGVVDYDKLLKRFGTEPITPELMKRIKKHTGRLHFMLRRGLFYTHRDMNWILDEYEKGNPFYLYTGRGPSDHTHIGHLVPWIFTKWLQDKFDVEFIFQMTDDEKFLFKDKLTLEKTKKFAYDNALDVIALGFNPKKTQIIIDTENAKTLYNIALPISKKITFSTVKASFDFDNSTNLGQIFYTSIQAAPAVLKSVQQGKEHTLFNSPWNRSRSPFPSLQRCSSKIRIL